MNLRITLILFSIFSCLSIANAQWIVLDTDMIDDGNDPTLLDGIEYAYRYDVASDSLWFRMTAVEISEAQSMDLGVNVMVYFPNPGPDEFLFQFWSPGNNITWHRLVTVWVTGSAPSNYTGTAGISKGDEVTIGNYTTLVDGLTVIVDQSQSTIVIGMNRADLIPNDQTNQDVELAAAIGSSTLWNDDFISTGVIPTVNLDATISNTHNLISNDLQFYPNPAQDFINIKSDLDIQLSFLEFYDLSGRYIQKTRITQNTNVDISSLSNGLYLLKAYTQEGIFVGGTKLIKLH